MKKFIALSLLISTGAFAGQTTIRDSADLKEANARNMTGTLNVALSASNGAATISVARYKGVVECLEYGPAEIPRHNETAPCLKDQQTWVPVVEVLSLNPSFTLTVNNSTVPLEMGAVSEVPESCIKNLKEATVVTVQEPKSIVTNVVVDANCSAYNGVYTYDDDREDRGDISFKPKVMKGKELTVRVSAAVYSKLNLAQDLSVGAQAISLQSLPVEIKPSQVDLSSKAFQYDIRLFVK